MKIKYRTVAKKPDGGRGVKRKQTRFKNWCCTMVIRKSGIGYVFYEAQCRRNPDDWSQVFLTYEKAVKQMQRYSREHYGEKSK